MNKLALSIDFKAKTGLRIFFKKVVSILSENVT